MSKKHNPDTKRVLQAAEVVLEFARQMKSQDFAMVATALLWASGDPRGKPFGDLLDSGALNGGDSCG
ncbi:MAG: hypothetical protein EBR82_25305 [Caulobacteraceae bacterium]|nr:hypothetical protein [Caulobacteraceae bacterium]